VQRTNAALSKGNEFSTALVAPAVSAKEIDNDAANYQYVTSPMVGTFYLSPTPGDPPFVKVGEKIDKHSIVCIIEAMKVMNEVKAGNSGTIVEQLVEDGHPVEFGTKLFKISQ
jgi:acetyl-CoA carboxylase biotin carboxyl carrier protein